MGKRLLILLSLKRAHEQAKEWLGQVCRIDNYEWQVRFIFGTTVPKVSLKSESAE